ncbi:MAG TPA: SGNH/GDSL hydrolase family protein [Planctomycetota bacterium]
MPRYAGEKLPRVSGKLQRKEGLRVALTGDSISAGANASSKGYPPHEPPYSVLLAAELEVIYGGRVDLVNVSVGGATADGGFKGIQKVLDAKPDLVIISYGMNDVAGRNPTHYADTIKAMISAVRASQPDTEFMLVSTSLANSEWNWTPADQFPKYRDALTGLLGHGMILADCTALWTDLLARKRYHDLTGNGVNHPNDFGHRLYAQVLLSLLVDEKRMQAQH